MGGNLEELSKQLAASSHHPSPEEYIKQTLLAHGFFRHTQNNGSNSVPAPVEGVVNLSSKKSKDKIGGGISEDDKRRTTQLVSHFREGRQIHALKEPRSLFARPNKHTVAERLPLWPAEVDCVSHRTKFITVTPTQKEPFYCSSRDVVSPKIRSQEGGGTVVYTNLPGPQKYYISARAGPNVPSHGSSPRRAPDDISLVFESRFESGNLAKAVQVGKWDYELYLRYDLYTNKHTQWFYFSVRNMREGQTYRFTIVNLYKSGSLYNEGMQPVMYSTVKAKRDRVGWRRVGHAIKYFKTPIRRLDCRGECYYFGLTWSHTFEHDNDTCYFAHCYPYTYCDLQDYLRAISSDPVKSGYVKHRTLCKTIAGNPVPLLTITSSVQSPEENTTKRGVVITSRVHPGETNGSWMMKGLLDFLLGSSPDAKILRDSFIFKIVPMLNPDGVIVGNYRCSLAGRDLNRNYRTKLKESYPTVWHLKAMVKRFVAERNVVMYCDLHGHSKKQNVFIYGCDTMDNPLTRLKARVFPKMLSKNAPSMFSYKDSRFGVHKSKEGTGRVVMWKEMGITNSYTMEATFCGSVRGKKSGFQFTTSDLESMGYHFCDTLLDYCDPDQSKVNYILHALEEEYRASILRRLAALGHDVPSDVDPLDIQLSSQDDLESSDAGSDSSVSDGPPVHMMKARKKKKKKLKSRRERDKHKALLKLTHHTPTKPTPQPPPSQIAPSTNPTVLSYNEFNKKLTNLDSQLYRFNQTEATPRNGGIPIFIKERIEERVKRRSDAESAADRFSDEADYVEAVASEYLKQGLPMGIVQEMVQCDPRSSTSLLPPPPTTGCPMSITPMALYEGRVNTRPPSRMSSNTSLPLLGPKFSPLADGLITSSRGAFTSNYVAHHLTDIMTSPTSPGAPPPSHSGLSPMSGSATINSTKNLSNLSHLFRQLRPHLLQTHASSTNEARISKRSLQTHAEETTTAKTKTELPSAIPPPLQPTTNAILRSSDSSLGSSREKLQVVMASSRFLSGGESSSGEITKKETSYSESFETRERKKRDLERERIGKRKAANQHMSFSRVQQQTPVRPVASKERADKRLVDDKLEQLLNQQLVANHERKDVQILLSSHVASPLTSSWESFSQPLTLTDRTKEQESSAITVDSVTSNGNVTETAPKITGTVEPTKTEQKMSSNNQPLSEDQPPVVMVQKRVGESLSKENRMAKPTKGLPVHIPKTYSAPEQKRSLSSVANSNHSNHAHLSQDTSSKMSDIKTHMKRIAEAVDSVHSKQQQAIVHQSGELKYDRGNSSNHLPTENNDVILHHHTTTTTTVQEDVGVVISDHVTGSDSVCDDSRLEEHYNPVAVTRMYSSRASSRFSYYKPSSSDHKVRPATVSLMLSGRIRPRPSAVYSSRPSRPLHIKYYNRKKITD